MRGAQQLLSRLSLLPDRCEKAAQKAALSAAEITLRKARIIVPVRTGYLKSTLTRSFRDQKHLVGTSCHYAFFVEGGTRFMRAQPYLTPAYRAADYLSRAKRSLLEAIK